jgi:hypothetical protein
MTEALLSAPPSADFTRGAISFGPIAAAVALTPSVGLAALLLTPPVWSHSAGAQCAGSPVLEMGPLS